MRPEWRGEAVGLVAQVSREVSAARVAVVGRGGPVANAIASQLRGQLQGATVTVHDANDETEVLHVDLAAAGPFDSIVDIARAPGVADRFGWLLYHLREGGRLVVRRPVAERDDLDPLVSRLLRIRDDGAQPPSQSRDPRPRRQADEAALAYAMGAVQRSPEFVVAGLRVDVLAKLVDRLTDRFLDRSPESGTVLQSLPAGSFLADCDVGGSDTERVGSLPDVFGGPDLSVRAYRDVVCLPHSGVVGRSVVFPDTYRRRQKSRMRSAALVDWSHWFALAPKITPRPLEGSFFHLDNEWRGHFGHALTEQVSKTWAWEQIRAQAPDVRALVTEDADGPVASWEYDLWEAAGIPRDRVEVVREPVLVNTLYAASPAYALPDVVHPVLGEVYSRVGSFLDRDVQPQDWPNRVFLSRRRSHQRWCHNAHEVEALMTEHGFRVVYPEDLPFREQVLLVRRADVIGGFTGSGMYQIAMAGSPKRVIAIGSESYTATAEYTFSALMGHRIDFVWCAADVPVGETFSRAAFKSDFTYDDRREGRFLRSVLDRL